MVGLMPNQPSRPLPATGPFPRPLFHHACACAQLVPRLLDQPATAKSAVVPVAKPGTFTPVPESELLPSKRPANDVFVPMATYVQPFNVGSKVVVTVFCVEGAGKSAKENDPTGAAGARWNPTPGVLPGALVENLEPE